MDITILGIIITLAISIIGLFGWSHASIKKELMKIESELQERPTNEEMRLYVSDRLAPHKVEYHALNRRMDEIRENHKELSRKLDQVIEICSKLQ